MKKTILLSLAVLAVSCGSKNETPVALPGFTDLHLESETLRTVRLRVLSMMRSAEMEARDTTVAMRVRFSRSFANKPAVDLDAAYAKMAAATPVTRDEADAIEEAANMSERADKEFVRKMDRLSRIYDRLRR